MSGGVTKLKIVFLLDTTPSVDVRVGDKDFRQLTHSGGVGKGRKLQMLIDSMKLFSIPLEFKRSDGEVIPVAEFAKRLENQGKWGGPVEAGGLLFQVGNVPAMRQGFVLIEEKIPGAAHSWDTWVSPFLGEPDFVQAWVSDVEYDHWQNASDPIEYTVVGRDYSHLPLRSNGLPFPLEQLVIDTSANPGRWTMRMGYIEAVGSTMWLGGNFWRAVGKEPGVAIDETVFRISSIEGNVVKVIALDQCFCDQSTAAIQDRLRINLFCNL